MRNKIEIEFNLNKGEITSVEINTDEWIEADLTDILFAIATKLEDQAFNSRYDNNPEDTPWNEIEE